MSNRLGTHGSVQVSTLYKSLSAAVLAASSDWLGPLGYVQVSWDDAASTAADDDFYTVETSTDRCGHNWSNEAARTAADDDLYGVGTHTDPCSPNLFNEAASTAGDDDFYRVETCTDPCGPNQFDKAATTTADDDLHGISQLYI